MFLKLTGCVLVIVSSCALGIWKAGQWKEHRRSLEQIRKMILLLKAEILYAHAPLGEAFWHVGRKTARTAQSSPADNESDPLSRLFLQAADRIRNQAGDLFYEIWKEETKKVEKELLLTQKEFQEFQEFGEHLGFLDLGMQERTMTLYLEQLEMSIGFYREHEREQMKLCTSLGLMGGLFLSIMMC